MLTEKPLTRSKKSGIAREEERAWVGFYRRVRGDPAIAAEVMAQLDADPDSKRNHLALYLCCRESLRRAKARQARNKQFGRLVRWCCHRLFIAPVHGLRSTWQAGGELAAACLPDMADSSSSTAARQKIRRTASGDGFAKFDASAHAGTAAKATRNDTDRTPMAA